MAVILHIDSSARSNRSITRDLGAEFKRQWQAINPDDNFIYRDVGTTPPDFISEQWVAAAFTAENARTDEQKSLLSLSDQMIEELSLADIIVISSPMYNYGMPATLKAWIDQVVRVNKTFTFDLERGDFPLDPILSNKTLLLLTSSGEFGFGINEIREGMDHLTPHLKTVSKYFGANEEHEIRVEYQEFGDHRHTKSKEDAYLAIPKLISEIANKYNE